MADRTVVVGDLYYLIDWVPDYEPEHAFELDNGYYRLTLCGDRPASGILGDHQQISIYMEPWREMPNLRFNGVPTFSE